MSVEVFAPAKINLTLEVGRPRTDGLHPLQSLVMFADVGDAVGAAEGEGLSLSIRGEFADALSADDNLVLRAARALAAANNIAEPQAALSLEKNLPVAAGMGGGSADAAAALRALSQLWGLHLPLAGLADIGRELGADVPVCVMSQTALIGGIGETIAPVAGPAFAAVLVNPLVPLPTINVYRQFDRMKLGRDLGEGPPATPIGLEYIATRGNDLEPAARALLPELEEVAALLASDPRVLYAGMSGSGATMFALVESREGAGELAEAWQRARRDWWVSDTTLGAA